jgi:DHA2 family multidrug resistance protein
MLVEHVSPFNHAYGTMMQGLQQSLAAHVASAGNLVTAAQARLAAMVAQQALALSFIDAFWLMGVAFLAALPLVLLLREGKASKGAAMQGH